MQFLFVYYLITKIHLLIISKNNIKVSNFSLINLSSKLYLNVTENFLTTIYKQQKFFY